MATEQQLIDQMQQILQEKMEQDYVQGNTKRDAHPKCLGLLKAKFMVHHDIPLHLKHGIFAHEKTFNALIRSSNASGAVQSDKQKDFRGFGIKLLGVEGARINNNEQQTQDFLLMSHPTMPLGTVKLFRDAVYYSIKVHPLALVLKLLLTGRTDILKIMKGAKKNDTSPLDIQYWSTTPYQLGNTKVKYKLVPTSQIVSKLPAKLTDDYLTQNIDAHLADDVATFDFYVQEFINNKQTPIEDAGVEWQSEYIKVASIEIPQQKVNKQSRFELAEKLSFSPANALQVHAPIGGINRARIKIYTELNKFRHKRDNIQLIEPTNEDFKNII